MKRPPLSSVRRVSQIVFFAAFLFLLFQSEFTGSFRGASGQVRLPWPVCDLPRGRPAGRAHHRHLHAHALQGLLWSLVILVPTFFLGRLFCGWVCPFGTLHHFFGSFKSEKKRGKSLLESNRYKPWHAVKYYLLAAVLARGGVRSRCSRGCSTRSPLTVRSLALSIVPGVNYASGALLDAWYQSPGARCGLPPTPRSSCCRARWSASSSRTSTRRSSSARSSSGCSPSTCASRGSGAACSARSARSSASSRAVALRHGEGPREVHRLQPVPRALPGRRRSAARREVAAGRVPHVPQLRDGVPQRT